MAKNRMADVATLLGVELGKEIIVRPPDGWCVKAKLTKNGAYEDVHGAMGHSYRLLTELLIGKAEIVQVL